MPIAVVTGAGRGIGFETARQLAAEGYRVIAVDREADLLANMFNIAGLETVEADIGTPEGQQKVKNVLGNSPLAVLAHIAHATTLTPLLDMDLETHRDIQRSNIEAPIFLTKALLDNIKATHGKCRIILTGAPVADAYKPIPTGGSLFMTKVAIKYLANVLRLEMKGVAQIGYIEPGLTRTPFIDNATSSKGPLGMMVTKRIAANQYYTQETTGEWIVALLKQTDEVFASAVHKEDNPAQAYGVEFPETPERKGKWEYTDN